MNNRTILRAAMLAALLLLTILLVWLCLSGTGESGLTVVEITAPVWAVDTPEPSTTKRQQSYSPIQTGARRPIL